MKIQLLFLLLIFNLVFAQLPQMQIAGQPEKESSEFVGSNIKDPNGRICAAVKVVSNLDGLKYQSYNGVVKIDDQPGKDMVYLQPDERVLEIFKSGFEPLKIILSEVGITLQSKQIWKIKISGEAEISKLSIAIITQPTGATVELDGRNLGNIESVLTGKGQHNLRLTLSGYEPVIQSIYVDEQNTLFKYTLKKVQDVPIEIKTEPAGATVYLDNLKFGETPLTNFYPTGKYPIRIEKEWYVTYEDYLDITPPNTRKTFTLNEDFGSLQVTSTPESGLTIYVDGKATSFTTPHTFERLKPATYAISAKGQFYESLPQSVTITRKGKQNITLSSSPNYALLNITTYDGANIYLNGQKTYERNNIRLEPQVVVLKADMPPKGKAVEKRVVLKKNDNQTIEIYPLIATGNLQVAVTPFEANIELKGDAGEHYTATMAKMFTNIPTGRYELTIKKDGYKTHTANLTVTEGQTTKHSAVLVEGSDVPENMVLVKGGTFTMGSHDGKSDQKPPHQVKVSNFYIGKYEVTQKEWLEVMGNNPSFIRGDNNPVEQVTWFNVVEFCNKKSILEGLTPCYSGSGYSISCDFMANGYRLPTEAEWEYAARGGHRSRGYRYSGSNIPNNVAWYKDNSVKQTHSIGGKQANELGIYDMSGNVWEWCWDWYDENYYSNALSINPKGPHSGIARVLRGGSCVSQTFISSFNRYYGKPGDRIFYGGFRLSRTP